MSKLFVSERALMSSSIQFMTPKPKTGAKRQATATGQHKISRRHPLRAPAANIVHSDSSSCAVKLVRSKTRSCVVKCVVKYSKSKTTKSIDTEPTVKDSMSSNHALLPDAPREIEMTKSTAKKRQDTSKCKVASSFSAAFQNRGKTLSSILTSLASKKHASTKTNGHQARYTSNVSEKWKNVAKRQHTILGDNLNTSSPKHLQGTRHATKTVSYTIRRGKPKTETKKKLNRPDNLSKSSNENLISSRSSRMFSATRAARVGRSDSPRANLIPFPKISLLKLTRRAATASSLAEDSSAAKIATSTNSDSTEGEVVTPDTESLGPASYVPASSRLTSISIASSFLDKSGSKPRLKKVSRGGVVRTRIVRKKKAPCYATSPTSNITQNGTYSSAMNPCDGGELNANQAISVVFNDSNRCTGAEGSKRRDRDAEINATSAGNAAFSLASSSELMKSSFSGTTPSKDLATSVSDSRTNSHKRRARAGGENECPGRHKVHVTRIRRSSARPPGNANNNADSPDAEDSEDKVKKPQRKRSDINSSGSTARSSRSSNKSSEEKDTLDNSSSKSTPTASDKGKGLTGVEPEIKKRVKKQKPKKPKEVKVIPKCPLFQGWDYDSELGEHTMTRLPIESDLAAQLSKRAKFKIWELRGRPHNNPSMVGSPTRTAVKTANDELKSYLARHSIEEFIQHLTHSVLIKPEDESVVSTLIEQGQLFKQTLKYDIDTDAFLKYVFGAVGNQPIAFPSVTKTRNIEPEEGISRESTNHTPVGRRSAKRSFDIVIGMPGLVYEPRLSARWDMEHRNTLQVGHDRPYFDTIRNDPSSWMQN